MLAYELLEGAAPWRTGDALGLVAAILTEEPPRMAADVPARVKAIVLRALSKAPAERFGSMDDVVDVLEPFAAGAQPGPSAAPPAPAAPAARSRPDQGAGAHHRAPALHHGGAA